MYSLASEQRRQGDSFCAAAASNLRGALQDALQNAVEPLPGDSELDGKVALLATRWGVSGKIWKRMSDYGDSWWLDGRSGEIQIRYSVVGRPGMPAESSGAVEQRGFDMTLRRHTGESETHATLSYHGEDKDLMDSEALCWNKQLATNVDDLALVTGAEALAQDIHGWGVTRVAQWMESNEELKMYSDQVKQLKLSGETLDRWRLGGGEGFDAADESVRALGFTDRHSREMLRNCLNKSMPALPAYYFAAAMRDNRDPVLTMKFERGIDGSVLTGRGRRPTIHTATGLTSAGRPGDLIWTIDQKAMRESLSKPRIPVTFAQLEDCRRATS